MVKLFCFFIIREADIAWKRNFSCGEPWSKTLPFFNYWPVVMKSVKTPSSTIGKYRFGFIFQSPFFIGIIIYSMLYCLNKNYYYYKPFRIFDRVNLV